MIERYPYTMTRARHPSFQPSERDEWGVAWHPGDPHPGYASFDADGKLLGFNSPIENIEIRDEEMTPLKVAQWAVEQDGDHVIIHKDELEKLAEKPTIQGEQHEKWVLTMNWHYGTEEEHLNSLKEAKERKSQWISTFGDVFSNWKVTKQVRFTQETLDLE